MTDTQLYKAMLALTPDERRALNTFAAIASLTPNRYVEAVLRAQLVKDGEALGIPLPPVGAELEAAGQLTIADRDAAGRVAKPKRAPAAKKDSPPRRRTGRQGGR